MTTADTDQTGPARLTDHVPYESIQSLQRHRHRRSKTEHTEIGAEATGEAVHVCAVGPQDTTRSLAVLM